MTTLPQPRELLTSLVNAISNIPLAQPVSVHGLPGSRESSFHPLKAVPVSYRHLLTTLHVLFPTLLLPALDLLDRSLVTRLVVDGIPSGGDPSEQLLPHAALYLVRSARPTSNHPRRHQAHPPTGNTYAVRLGAWNCSCAAFAFAAFPTAGTGGREELKEPESPQSIDHGEEEEENEEEEDDDDGRDGLQASDRPNWSFGGTSCDGTQNRGNDGVPCCKHLLACLLAERWHAALGGYVVERRVGREEMAGIIADV